MKGEIQHVHKKGKIYLIYLLLILLYNSQVIFNQQ